MDLEAALAEIENLKTQLQQAQSQSTALVEEKARLISKRDELLAKNKKFKEYEKYLDQGIDIEELLTYKDQVEKIEAETKAKLTDLSKKEQQRFEERIKALELEREKEKQEREQERAAAQKAKLDADIIQEFSKASYGIYSPRQLHLLVGNQIKRSETDNKLVVVQDGFSEIPIERYITEILKGDPEYQNCFKGTITGGSGFNPGENGNGTPRKNPFKRGTADYNLSEQSKILREQPELAKRLKAEAGLS